jgi:MFS family permease
VAVNALVGGMVGQERTVVPLLAESEFGLSAYAGMLSFIAVFGVTKALVNLVAGQLADRFGRKPVLIAGWLVGLPVPLILIFAPSWGWVIAANVLLGVNQGLAWSLTVIMKIDLAGPHRRGLAMGLNEGAGYGAVALAAWATGAIAEATSLRPGPFLLGLAFAALGLGLSATVVRETAGPVGLAGGLGGDVAGGDRAEPADQRGRPEQPATSLSAREVFAVATWRNRSLSAASQAGLVNNLNEGAAWGLFPIVFAAAGLPVAQVGLLTAVAPAVWGVGQLATGWWSDRVGRKRLIAAGQWTEAAGLAVIAAGGSFWVWAVGSALFGAGTALA